MLPGGKLYAPGAEKIIPRIASLVKAGTETGALIVSSGDAHTQNDPEFQKFPPHCIAGTPGAEIIPEGLAKSFRAVPNDSSRELPKDVLTLPQIIFEKQTLDVFDNPKASALVDRLPSDTEYIVFGVVTEYCVQLAAKGLLRPSPQSLNRKGRNRSPLPRSRPQGSLRFAVPRRPSNHHRRCPSHASRTATISVAPYLARALLADRLR